MFWCGCSVASPLSLYRCRPVPQSRQRIPRSLCAVLTTSALVMAPALYRAQSGDIRFEYTSIVPADSKHNA